MLSNQAQVAKLIRKELKEKYPKIKFVVRSSSFSGGNDVNVDYTNGVPADEIRKITNKYQAGSFDGMTDMYNYDYDKTGVTAKYIFANRNITNDIREKARNKIAKDFGIANIDDENEWQKKFNAWSSVMVHRYLFNRTILNDGTIEDNGKIID